MKAEDNVSDLHKLWWLFLILVSCGILYLLSPILTPFLLAAVIAYICNPLVTWLSEHKIPRTFGVVMVMLLSLVMVTALILIMVPLFEKEASRLLEKIPSYIEVIKNQAVPWFESQFGISLQPDMQVLKDALSAHWQSAGGVAAKVLPSLTTGGMAIVEFFVNLLLVPVVLFYLLRDWNQIIKLIDNLIPRYWHKTISHLARETDKVMAEFLRGQLSVILIMSVCYIAGLWFVGLEFALPIGLVAGILVFVPYLGMIVGLTLATFAAFMQFQGWAGVIPVWIVFAVGQLFEGMVITPWLVGERIGLHPVIVIFALLAFGQLFGFFGILLALPVSAVMLVWLRHFQLRYLESNLYKS